MSFGDIGANIPISSPGTPATDMLPASAAGEIGWLSVIHRELIDIRQLLELLVVRFSDEDRFREGDMHED